MKKSIEVEVYETEKGNPTCSTSFREGKTCIFLEVTRIGTSPACRYCRAEIFYCEEDYLEPHELCPLHKKDTNK